jgi:hypothetical protein
LLPALFRTDGAPVSTPDGLSDGALGLVPDALIQGVYAGELLRVSVAEVCAQGGTDALAGGVFGDELVALFFIGVRIVNLLQRLILHG